MNPEIDSLPLDEPPIHSRPVAGPTTQSFRLRWLPEPERFNDQRTPILRTWEDLAGGPLELFSVGAQSVDGRLSEFCWVSAADSGITLNLLEDADETPAAADRAIRTAVAALAPLRFSHVRTSYQHVVGLPFQDVEQAIDSGQEKLFRDLSTDDVRMGDWALLADFAIPGPPESAGQVEFGIVRADEVPFRLNRLGGRGPGMQHFAQLEWDPAAFKEVSLFADSNVRTDAPDGRETEFLDEALGFWSSSRSQMTRLVEDLRLKMIDNQDGGKR
jgi:hypothetical protein